MSNLCDPDVKIVSSMQKSSGSGRSGNINWSPPLQSPQSHFEEVESLHCPAILDTRKCRRKGGRRLKGEKGLEGGGNDAETACMQS